MSNRQRGHYPYPDDEFDQIAHDQNLPHGVHRTRAGVARRLVPFLIVIIVVPTATFLGVTWWLNNESHPNPVASGPLASVSPPASSSPSAPDSTGTSPSPSASATIDYSVSVETLNNAGRNGVAGDAKDKLESVGFADVTASNFSTDVLNVNPTKSTVYYSSPDLAATADAVAKALGVTATAENPDANYTQADIAVVLRSDYGQ